MNTPTHLLLSVALLAKPGEKRRNWAVIAGSLIPYIGVPLYFSAL